MRAARLLVPILLLPALLSAAAADDAPSATALRFVGSARFEKLGTLGEEVFRLELRVENATKVPLALRRGRLFLRHRGGWLRPLDPIAVDGSFGSTDLTVAPAAALVLAARTVRAVGPATHVLMSGEAADGVARAAIPIERKGFAAPPVCAVPGPFAVGIAGPLTALPFSDGKIAVLLIGQHQILDGSRPTDVETTISLGSDKGSIDPVTWKGLDAKGDLRALWPFARRVEVFDGFGGGRLRLTSTARVKGRRVSFASSWPVVLAAPVVVRAPVLGTWQLSNGPGQEVRDRDVSPQARYAYDMLVLKRGRTHEGDPHVNASYFAWNRSIRAVADGEVVDVCEGERDNPGYRGSLSTCHNNRVVIKHAGGLYTAYLHIRRGSVARGVTRGAQVHAGQVIARVGNSGDSTEPHLHFMAFRIDETGRASAVPVAFSNAWHDAKASRQVVGVPLGGRMYHFRDPP